MKLPEKSDSARLTTRATANSIKEKIARSSKTFNDLLALFSRDDWNTIFFSESYKSFGCGDYGFFVSRLNADKFDAAVRVLFEFDKTLDETYSRDYFEREVADLLCRHQSSEASITHDEVMKFFDSLLGLPIQRYTVLRKVQGIRLASKDQMFPLGPFTIYSFTTHKALLAAKAKVSEDELFPDDKPEYLIGVEASARHHPKAVELADVLFEKFELCMRYVIGQSSDHEIGVIQYRGWSQLHHCAISEDGQAFVGSWNSGPIFAPEIDTSYFVNPQLGFDRMWSTLASSQPTSLAKRFLLAIEWLGQSYRERTRSSAFLKAAIALEVLFVVDEKAFVSASITSQISETVAMLLGTNNQDRQKIITEMKGLYKTRSAIVHSGTPEVDKEKLQRMWHLSRAAIMKVMTAESLQGMESMNDIHEFIKVQKYGFAAI